MVRVMLIAGCLLLPGDVNPVANDQTRLDRPVSAREQPGPRERASLPHVIEEKY